MRVAAKRDQNEHEIIRALELAGWSVFPVSDTGLMDLLCIRRGVIRLLEVKGPKGKLTPAQEKTFARIRAAGGEVKVVRTPAEALLAVAQGVEAELGPRTKPKGDWLEAMKEFQAESERLMGLSPHHFVTPEFQREQTESVVPRRKKKAGA